MIYTPENTVDIGRPVEVFDKSGHIIDDVVMVDTDKETVTFHARDERGFVILDNSKVQTITKHYPGLTVSFIKRTNPNDE